MSSMMDCQCRGRSAGLATSWSSGTKRLNASISCRRRMTTSSSRLSLSILNAAVLVSSTVLLISVSTRSRQGADKKCCEEICHCLKPFQDSYLVSNSFVAILRLSKAPCSRSKSCWYRL